MLKRKSKIITSWLILFILLAEMILSIDVYAATERTGTLGDNGGFKWTYNETTKTLTVTGEDTGLKNRPFKSISNDIEKIILNNCKFKDSIYQLFDEMQILTSIEFNNCDTSEVTDMASMFGNCKNLTNLDVSKFNTSNVKNMAFMFYGCSSLKNIDISNFDTSNVTDMTSMFSLCENIENINVSGLDTSNVKSIAYMFCECKKLEELNISSFDTSKVTNMEAMFAGCRSIDYLDVSKIDTSMVTSMACMFQNCKLLSEIDVSGFDTSNVTNMSWMFYCCERIKSLETDGFKTSNVTDMSHMFDYCYNLEYLDVSGFDTSNVANFSTMFASCTSVKELDVSGFVTSKALDMSGMFRDCKSVNKIDVSGFDTSNVTNMFEMFKGCEKIIELDMSGFDTSKINNIAYMLEKCENLEIILTPKTVNMNILLPKTFYDTDMKSVSEITSKNCASVLVSEKEHDIKVNVSITSTTNCEDFIWNSTNNNVVQIEDNWYKKSIDSRGMESATLYAKLKGVSAGYAKVQVSQKYGSYEATYNVKVSSDGKVTLISDKEMNQALNSNGSVQHTTVNKNEAVITTLTEKEAWELLKFLELAKIFPWDNGHDKKSDLYKYMIGKGSYTPEEERFFKIILLTNLYSVVDSSQERLYSLRDDTLDMLKEYIDSYTNPTEIAKNIIKDGVTSIMENLIPGFEFINMIEGEYGNVESIITWANLANTVGKTIGQKYTGSYILDYIDYHHREGYSAGHQMALDCVPYGNERWAQYLYGLSCTVSLPVYSRTSVHCPGDLSIYDKDGEQVMLLTNDMVGCTQTPYAEYKVVHDEESDEYFKTVTLYDDSYTVEIIGTGNGYMDIEHIKYSDDVTYIAKESGVTIVENNTLTIKDNDNVIILDSKDESVQTHIEVDNKEFYVDGIEILNEDCELSIGELVFIKTKVSPIDTKDIIVVSDNASVLSVENGTQLRGIAAGEAVVSIYVRGYEDIIVNKTFTVTEDIVITNIVSEENSCSLKKDETYKFNIVTSPIDAQETVLWHSEDEMIATVDENGVVMAVSAGETKIIVESYSGNVRKSFKVTVNENTYPLKVEIQGAGLVSGTEKILSEGDNITLTASPLHECSRFVGWYVEGVDEKISQELALEYVIPAEETTLIALFEISHLDEDKNTCCDICLSDISEIAYISLDAEDDLKRCFYARLSEKYKNATMKVIKKGTITHIDGIYDENTNMYKFEYILGKDENDDNEIIAMLLCGDLILDFIDSENIDTQIRYEIFYELNGGIQNETNPGFYYKSKESIVLEAPVRDGYEFEGWYNDNEYTTQITEISKGSTGNMTLYAKWSEKNKLSISVQADKTQIKVGDSVVLSATAIGGDGNYTYSFLVHNKDTKQWARLTKSFTANNSYTWKAISAGNREFFIEVKDGTGKLVRSEALNINTVNKLSITGEASASIISVGDSIELFATATGGSGDYTYSYLVHNKDTEKWFRFTKEFVENNSYKWKATSIGNRDLYIEVKDSNGEKVRSKAINVKVVDKLSVTANATASSVATGESITISGEATGGIGEYTYSFIIYNRITKQWYRLADNITSNKFTWKAGSSGERVFYVDVKDSTGKIVRSKAVEVNVE